MINKKYLNYIKSIENNLRDYQNKLKIEFYDNKGDNIMSNFIKEIRIFEISKEIEFLKKLIEKYMECENNGGNKEL